MGRSGQLYHSAFILGCETAFMCVQISWINMPFLKKPGGRQNIARVWSEAEPLVCATIPHLALYGRHNYPGG